MSVVLTKVDGFTQIDRTTEYRARFSIRGEITVTIQAESLDEARSKASEMAEDEEFGHELDEVHDVNVDYVWKTKPMFFVLRDGRRMGVSRLEEGDAPRDPSDGECYE